MDVGIFTWTNAATDPALLAKRAEELGFESCWVPEHNPFHLAKKVASLDQCSRGRFIFGIGAGGLREQQKIMGTDFDHRWTQTWDAMLAMKQLWTQDEAEYHGTYYDFPPVKLFPKPAQEPYPPVFLGGTAKGVLLHWSIGGFLAENRKRARAAAAGS